LIPKAIIHTLNHQDLAVLYEIRDLVLCLISERGKPPLAEELPDDREVLDVQTTGCITYRLEKVSCGKNCKGCPHGPYWYGYWREGGKTHSKYIGKNLLSTETKDGVVV
jgi:hypothetical protein